MLSLAAGTPEEGHTYPLHHPQVTFNEEALPYGVAALSYMALEYLRHND
jgi:metal-dependent amidase/aminoacylase/carboxypeptidase family protein